MKTVFTFLIVLMAACFATLAAQACPAGAYDVKGWNPGVDTAGTPSYTGTADISANGPICQMTWKISTQSFSGVGFYEAGASLLNISYAELKQGWFGEVSYKATGNTLDGKWAVFGDKTGKVGKEVLTKK